MEITGQCFCGEIAYRATIDPNRVGLCHCRDCQISSGSAFRVVAAVDPENFAFTNGSPRTFTKVSDRGFKRHLTFCGTCGTQLCAVPDPDSDLQSVSVRLATCDQFAELRPSGEVFCSSRVDWLSPLEGTKQFERMPVM